MCAMEELDIKVAAEVEETEQPQEPKRVEPSRGTGELVAGLDIGTTKICAVIGEVFEDGCVNIIGVGTAASSGMKKGVVVNIEATVKAIRQAIDSASDMAGCDIETVYVGIAGTHIKGFNSPGIIAINNQQIRQKEIQAVIHAAQTVKISDNQQIIHVLPQEYMVDDHTGIQNPLGMTGVRLATNVHIVTADVTSLHNLVTSCSRAGLNVAEVVLESVASARAVLTQDEMELGVALLDIGGGTTDLAVFCNGTIKYTWELALGGNNLTNDLSVGLRTPLQEAEMLKYRYGGAVSSLVKENHIIEVPTVGDRKARKVSQRVMVEILEARMEEILQVVNKKICGSGYRNRINAGMVITGGTALLANVVDMAEQVFDMPVRVSFPRGVGGRIEDVESPRCTTAVGLVLYGSNNKEIIPVEHDGILSRLRSFLKNII
ncbi:MAG: cell division protein FtsA [Candidatus Electrothrix aestuarii]|uniref:Cell division protein FtsA n=1 Tax=Candidatus Electrothrix aestuarii TaxID=3062594 RepID=A0AAU8LYU4_9BACT|nr:cell division protein FtsA [Candidatus Electrothrix aestuarii]WPD23203.1 MAG: cell division protein FtsA [Candidatus Electrothrix sp. GW3-3]